MWFKNLNIFRLPKGYAITAEQLHAFLSRIQFTACASNEMQSQGWASPRDNDQLVHSVNGQFLIHLTQEKKLLPTSVINQVAAERAAELEEQQGFAPGRKAMKDLKERITDELLPRAFSVRSSIDAWLDPVNGWLVINTSSASKADDVIKLLLKCVDTLPLEALRVQIAPQAAMTSWLSGNEAPKGFTIDQDAELKSCTEDRATVKYTRHTLEPDDVSNHIAHGKQCTQLAMTWNDRISFVLTDSLTIKRVRPLDILDEEKEKGTNEEERFDADFLLMTGELATMLDDVVYALGGEMDEQKDIVAEAAKAKPLPAATEYPDTTNESDPLYEKAAAVVVSERRASISLVQRHLRIGYNRAAHLIEAMEENGLVSAMNSAGQRNVIQQ